MYKLTSLYVFFVIVEFRLSGVLFRGMHLSSD